MRAKSTNEENVKSVISSQNRIYSEELKRRIIHHTGFGCKTNNSGSNSSPIQDYYSVMNVIDITDSAVSIPQWYDYYKPPRTGWIVQYVVSIPQWYDYYPLMTLATLPQCKVSIPQWYDYYKKL